MRAGLFWPRCPKTDSKFYGFSGWAGSKLDVPSGEGLGMVTLAYLALSFFCGIGAMLHYSVITGLIIWGASALAVIATGGTVLGAMSQGATYKVGSVLIGLALVALTYRLSSKFSIVLSGANVSGLTWCVIGSIVGAYWGFNIRTEGKHSLSAE
jgi:hypothetical protein